MSNSNKPKIFLVLKIIASILIVAGIVLIVLGTAVYPMMFNGAPHGPNPAFFVPGMVLLTFSLPILVFSFMPEFKGVAIKITKSILNANKNDLTDIANTTAEINKSSIYTTAKTASKGFKDGSSNTKFCKECGAEIDEDSKFCSKCGKKQ